MKSEFREFIYFGAFISGLALFVLSIIAYPTCPTPEEKALIITTFDSWGQNLDNEKEAIFSFWVENYGYIEAKNLTATCIILDEEGNRIYWIKKPIRNVASTSYNYEEISAVINWDLINENYTAGCMVINCDNCEILTKRIYKEDFEKYLMEGI